MVLFTELARTVGVPTPTMDAVIQTTSVLLGRTSAVRRLVRWPAWASVISMRPLWPSFSKRTLLRGVPTVEDEHGAGHIAGVV
jgi:hypothetical protein